MTTNATLVAARGAAGGRSLRLPSRAQQGLFLMAVLLVWLLVRSFDLVTDRALPSLQDVIRTFIDAIQTSQYWSAILETFKSAALGLAAAVVVGVPLGIVIGTYSVVEKSMRIMTEIGRSFPVIAVLPVLLLILGATLEMKSIVVFIACVFPLIIQSQYGAQSVGEAITETARSYRIPRLLRFRKVALPAASPSIMTGLRLTSTLAVLVSVSVEVLTPVPGIGHQIAASQVDDNPPMAWVYILTAGIIGYSINRLSLIAEGRLLSWRPPADLNE